MSKRGQTGAAGNAAKKRLSAKHFVARPFGGSRASSDGSAVGLDPVTVNVVKWIDDGRYFFDDLQSEMPMYQYQIQHEKKPSVLFQFLAELKKFIATLDPALPSLEEMEKQRFIRVAMPGDRFEDVDDVGIVPWRVALYAATDEPKSILTMINQFVTWKCQQSEFSSHGQPKIELTHSSKECLDACESLEGFDIKPMGSFSLHAFDAAPFRGKRHLVMNIEKGDDDNTYDILFFGCTWPFRWDFEKASIQGGYIEGESADKEYCRMLSDVLDDVDGRARLQKILTDTLKNMVVFLADNTDEKNNDLVKFLRGLTSVHAR